ncbi:hypothetical protein ABZ621_18760 [Streptomyces sp. NPDC007863]|uniref:hypothetical protein n=1 Tax=Streptomyces sp. NPDC007863 TaxID=3154894 RepID=UPI0033EFEAA0
MIGDPTQWQQYVLGEGYVEGRACQRAITFADLNDANLLPEDCIPAELGFTVTVHSKGTVGDSIVPGTAARRATATASAVIEPLCEFDSPDPSPAPDPSSTPSEDPEEGGSDPISGLTCDGEAWEIDPEDPVLPAADDLFRVRLTGDDE